MSCICTVGWSWLTIFGNIEWQCLFVFILQTPQTFSYMCNSLPHPHTHRALLSHDHWLSRQRAGSLHPEPPSLGKPPPPQEYSTSLHHTTEPSRERQKWQQSRRLLFHPFRYGRAWWGAGIEWWGCVCGHSAHFSEQWGQWERTGGATTHGRS